MLIGWVEVLLVVWGVCVVVATHIGYQRGFPVLGFLNGLVLGPLGLLNVLTSGDQTRQPCKSCSEQIKKAAKVCPHCGAAV